MTKCPHCNGTGLELAHQYRPVGEEIKVLKALRKHRVLMFFDALVRGGYVKHWPSGYQITEKGLDFLEKADK